MSDFNSLLGKKVVSLWVSQDKYYLNFVTEGGASYYYEAYGDCCSLSWFEEFIGIDALIGVDIIKVSEVDKDYVHHSWNYDEDELTQTYSVNFVTSKGRFDIVYRNVSNGYYGGDAVEIKLDNIPNDVKWKPAS